MVVGDGLGVLEGFSDGEGDELIDCDDDGVGEGVGDGEVDGVLDAEGATKGRRLPAGSATI